MLQSACSPNARQGADRHRIAVLPRDDDADVLFRLAPDFVRSALTQNLPATAGLYYVEQVSRGVEDYYAGEGETPGA